MFASSLAFSALSIAPKNSGNAIAISIAIIATTISNSAKVKPFLLSFFPSSFFMIGTPFVFFMSTAHQNAPATFVVIENTGTYIATTIKPTTRPIMTVIIGSSSDSALSDSRSASDE